MRWTVALVVLGLLIFACFLGSLLGGLRVGVFLLPLSGLFMSIVYPTLNSKAISCFPKHRHGAAAGVILFFTALAAAGGPLAMAAVSDAVEDPRAGFVLATVFALLLLVGLLLNWLFDPARAETGSTPMRRPRDSRNEKRRPAHLLRRPAGRHAARPAASC